MPVHKCSDGSWRIGSGKCMYDTKEDAVSAYQGYLAQKNESKRNFEEDLTKKLSEQDNPKDEVRMDVPFFIRLLELSRESINEDATLHHVAEKVIELSQRGTNVVTMDDYEEVEQCVPEENRGHGSTDTEEIDKMKRLAGMKKDESDY